MERVELEQRLYHIIANLNMDGLEFLNRAFGSIGEMEVYNINISKECIEEIRQRQLQEEAEKKAKEKEERRNRPSPYTLNSTMQLLGKQCSCDIICNQEREEICDILRARPFTTSMDTARDIFVLGYIHGKRAERKRRKK